ncbi:MAG: alpha/beta hydrolase family protein, partial [Planctomycetaceae bacterium]
LDVVPKIVQAADVDGQVFASTGHSLGDRTAIVFRVAGEVIEANAARPLRRLTPTDFERPGHVVRYPTTRGEWVISYQDGPPVGEFVPAPPPPDYADHRDLLYWLDPRGSGSGDAGAKGTPVRHEVRTPADWLRRRAHIQRHFERVAGEFPGPAARVAPRLEVREETRAAGLWQRKVRYQVAHQEWVSAWLLAPDLPNLAERPRPGVLCLQQTTEAGKDEPAGLAGDRELAYARELALRGFITLAPDYPSFGEHAWDFASHPEYPSGTLKAIWDNVVAVDVLQSLPEVARDRLGCIGHSLGGHNAIFTALFEPRLRAVVSSCGFTALGVDDLPSWTGPRYMPRIASEFQNDSQRLPFDFHELLGALAPRACLVSAATRDSDFAVAGVREVVDAARKVYAIHDAAAALRAIYPEAEHSFPRAARDEAYKFLEEALGLPGE